MNLKKQKGVALIAAIFLVVVIGGAVVLLSVLSLRNSQQTTQNLLQFRAQAAANAALEFAVQSLVEGIDCSNPALNGATNIPQFSDFTVTLSCASNNYNRPSQSITILNLSAIAQFGSPNAPDYVWTQIDATIEL